METNEFNRRFENFSKASTTRKTVCWTCILRFIEKNCQILENKKCLHRVLEFLFDVLMKYDCSDKLILYEALENYFRCHFRICECTGEYQLWKVSIAMTPFNSLKLNKKYGFSSIVNIETFPVCMTDFELMLILSKYGIYAGDSIFNEKNTRQLLKGFLLNSVKRNQEITISISKLISRVTEKILDQFKRTHGLMHYSERPRFYFGKYYHRRIHSRKQRGMRYIYLLIWTLHAVNETLKGNPMVDNIIQCLRVFFRTIPDPLVSQEDMKEFLQLLWKTLPLEFNNWTFITDIYIQLFKDESPMLYSPRSLKHLCRISLRKTLVMNLKLLPYSVRKLPIPRALHDYLLCIEHLSSYIS